MLRIGVSEEADSDINEIFLFIGHDSEDAAVRFLTAVFATIDILAQQPAIGTVRESFSAQLDGLCSFRVRGFPNYLIFYIAGQGFLRVIRVLHGAQDLESLLEG